MNFILNPTASNMTEVTLPTGTTVLFSYRTPVAARLHTGAIIRTNKKWSVTTSRHIGAWLAADKARAQECEQEFLDNLTDHE